MSRRLLQRLFGQNELDWLDRSYGIDWIMVLSIWALSWIAPYAPVFERSFDLKDPLISHPHGKDQVSSTLNFNLSLWLPIFIVSITGFLRGSLIEIHHGTIAVCAGRGLSQLITILGKHAVGRLRPDFLARCHWDKIIKACTGKPDTILSGRKSFPSGHSSTAFSGMTFLALWLAGKTAAWCFNTPKPPGSLRSSRMANFILTLLPLSWASFVAMSRVQDYRHHKEDVIVGSLIGIVCATVCYLIFWPNPFLAKNFEEGRSGKPRMLYAFSGPNGRLGTEFQLTRLDDDETEAV